MLKFSMIAVALLSTNPAFATSLNITQVAAQSLGLGTSVSVDVTVQADPAVQRADLSVDTAPLTQDKEHDISITVTPAKATFVNGVAQAKLTLTTKTSAPSFKDGTFALVAKSGSETARADIGLTVKAEYVVNVLQKKDGKCADNRNVNDRVSWICDFDSPNETLYFRKHDPSLQITFVNKTTDSFYIHGSDAIEHMHFDKGPLQPGKDYPNPPIMGRKEDPSNLKGSYTLHEIYRPSRDVVFNAETIPAARSR